MFDWMAWTTPVAVFFVCIVLMLIGMTVWEIRSPTALRKGFLPIATTRGDRLFIGLLSAAYVNPIFVGLSGRIAPGVGAAHGAVGGLGGRALGVVRFRGVHGAAGAGHAQGLMGEFQIEMSLKPLNRKR